MKLLKQKQISLNSQLNRKQARLIDQSRQANYTQRVPDSNQAELNNNIINQYLKNQSLIGPDGDLSQVQFIKQALDPSEDDIDHYSDDDPRAFDKNPSQDVFY